MPHIYLIFGSFRFTLDDIEKKKFLPSANWINKSLQWKTDGSVFFVPFVHFDWRRWHKHCIVHIVRMRRRIWTNVYASYIKRNAYMFKWRKMLCKLEFFLTCSNPVFVSNKHFDDSERGKKITKHKDCNSNEKIMIESESVFFPSLPPSLWLESIG